MNKIKLLLLSALLVGSSISAFAKGDDDSDKKGIRAGWQYSSFSYNNTPDTSNALGAFYVGIFNEKKIAPLLRFGTGLEYFQTGSNSSMSTKYVKHELSIPLYLKVKLGPIFVLGGAAANFTLAQKYSVNDETLDVPDSFKTKAFNVPLYAGLGVKIWIFSIEARYHMGMLDISKFETYQQNSQYFQLGAAVSF